jgi:hypothetical protein
MAMHSANHVRFQGGMAFMALEREITLFAFA